MCKQTKSVESFYVQKNYRWVSAKYSAYCKTCSLKRRKDWYEGGGREKVLAKAKQWRKDNPEEAKRRHKKWNWDSKVRAINAYGSKCECCGETEIKFLAIDHIKGDGNVHRKTIGNQTIYTWLKHNNYPTGFRILCHNCNMAIAFWKTCPHKI